MLSNSDKKKKKSSFPPHSPFTHLSTLQQASSTIERDETIRKKRKEKKGRWKEKTRLYKVKAKKKKALRKKEKRKKLHMEQFWGGEKLGKTNKLKARGAKKNIKKLIDNLKKRDLRVATCLKLKATNFLRWKAESAKKQIKIWIKFKDIL